MKPESVNILGTNYKITYCDKPSEVDIFKRDSLWGQLDYWTQTIRIHDNGSGDDKVWQTLIHEILHGIAGPLKLKLNNEDMHNELDILATALFDVLNRNGWLKQ
jgi:hypothetical protein